MSRPRSMLVLLSMLVLCAVAAPAAAQPAPADQKTRLAREYTEAGLAAQRTGDYAAALGFYAKAYAQVPHPILIFNVAQVHRLAGRRDAALENYRKYLAADPDGAMAPLAREQSTSLELQLAAEEAQRAEEARKAEAARKIEMARQAAEERKAVLARQTDAMRANGEAQRAESARRTEEAKQAAAAREAELARRAGRSDAQRAEDAAARRVRHRRFRIAGIATAGVGVVSLGVGAYFGLEAKEASDYLSTPGNVWNAQTYVDGETAGSNMLIATVAGAALIASGAALYYLGLDRGEDAGRVTLSPAVAPGHVGLVLAGGL